MDSLNEIIAPNTLNSSAIMFTTELMVNPLKRYPLINHRAANGSLTHLQVNGSDVSMCHGPLHVTVCSSVRRCSLSLVLMYLRIPFVFHTHKLHICTPMLEYPSVQGRILLKVLEGDGIYW